ncbi:MAG TPA: TraB/GumN family protein [Novosphingobium sp.]|nr:TraB/GumN family protein [Novosphingobium sp.]
MRRPRPAWRAAALALCLLAGACTKPDPASPALWRVDGPNGAHGWLFGTIHALPHKAAWRTPAVADALDQSDRLVVEIAGLNDGAALSRAFRALSEDRAHALPPLADRVAPEQRAALADLVKRGGLAAGALDSAKTWAAAIVLGQIAASAEDAAHGIDRDLIAHYPHAIGELEGAPAQFALFDALPEEAQRRLLADTLAGAPTAEADGRQLAAEWRAGDMGAIAAETRRGLLADPTLHEALYAARNRRWAAAIEAQMKGGAHPFVAVGAAHLAGAEGLPALLAADGWQLRRVE